MEFERGELVAHRGVGPGQEARADAIGDLAEPEIEARRLDLVGLDFGRARDLAAGDHGADGLARQNAGAGERRCAGRRTGPARRILGERLEKPVARGCWLHGWSSVTLRALRSA